MARKVNYEKRAEKIKSQIDELVQEILSNGAEDKEAPVAKKVKLSDIDFENEELGDLVTFQVRLSRAILAKSRE